jgi:hypothetical protein
MFLFHSLHHGSFRRRPARNVFAFVALSFLFTALLFTGCQDGGGGTLPKNDNKLDSNLIGTWTDPQFSDGYTITATHLTYADWQGEISYAGSIRYATSFSNTAGVIIIEYDADHKAKYYTDFDDDWNPIGDPLPLEGDFLGIYYQNLKSGESVQISGAIDPITYLGVEAATLNAAISKFTVDAANDYVSMWGGPYEKE